MLLLFLSILASSNIDLRVNSCNDQHCVECRSDDPDYCTSCSEGYGLDNNGETSVCEKCTKSNCIECNSSYDSCEKCDSGYYLDENGDCSRCQSPCRSCYGNAKNCTSCDGYYSYDDYEFHYLGVEKISDDLFTCSDCPRGCSDCQDNSNFCTKCSDRYGPVLDNNGDKTGLCQKCSYMCSSCDEDYTKCSKCVNFYNGVKIGPQIGSDGKPTGKCAPCDVNCESCSEDSSKCERCAEYYTLVEGKCSKCPNNCARCNTPSTCNTCDTGYVIDENDQCKACPNNCDVCERSGKCTNCKNGYTLVSEAGECKPCPANCEECENTKECSTCMEGYVKVVDENGKDTGECGLCPANCQQCTNTKECTYCKTGFGKVFDDDGKDTGKCEPCPANCYSCSSNSSKCYWCNDDYYNVKGKCIKLGEGCIKCLEDGTCTECESGYGLVIVNGKNVNYCQKCGEGCEECDSNYKDCDYCENYYKLVSYENGLYKCASCPDHCPNCDEDLKCNYCDYGYGKNKEGGCSRCSIANCDDCGADYTSCNRCIDGYDLKRTNDNIICDKNCPLNCYEDYCETINDEIICNVCLSGYGPEILNNGEKTGKCQACGEHCVNCGDNSKICLECEKGYSFVNDGNGKRTNRCHKCNENCQNCSRTDPNVCTSCKDGYGFVLDAKGNPTGKCQPCSQNCNYCTYDYTVCTQCQPGYGVVRKESGSKKVGQCQHCSSDCIYCNYDASFCTVCDTDNNDGIGSGFIVGSDGKYTGSCSKCNDNCGKCLVSSTCIKCNTGYTMINGECKSCPSNCNKCDSKLTCEECTEGYAFDVVDGQKTSNCVACPANCMECPNKNTCETCNDGFYLKKNSKDGYGDCAACSVANCLKCPNNECQECMTGFNFEDGKCSSCPGNCDECSNSTYCETCSDGYGLIYKGNGKMECGACPSNCISCTYANHCEDCKNELCSDANPYSPYYGQCIPCIHDTKCSVAHCSECYYQRSDECAIYEDGFLLDLLNRCVEEPAFVTMPPQSNPPDEVPLIQSKYNNGNYNFDDERNSLLNLKTEDATFAGLYSVTFANDNNKGVIIPNGYNQITLIKGQARKSEQFDIKIPEKVDDLNILLISESRASIESTKEGTKLNLNCIDGQSLNLNMVHPLSSLTINSENQIIIEEVEFKQEEDFGASKLTFEKQKAQIKSIKLQQERKGAIANAEITGTVIFAFRSNLDLKNVDLESATFECPYSDSFSPLQIDTALITGNLDNIDPPKKITLRSRNLGLLAAQERILIAQNTNIYLYESTNWCELWAEKIEYNGPYNGYVCDHVNDRLYVVKNEKEKKNKLSAGAIAGIVIGCVVFVGLVVFLLVYFLVIRKRKKSDSSEKEANDAEEA